MIELFNAILIPETVEQFFGASYIFYSCLFLCLISVFATLRARSVRNAELSSALQLLEILRQSSQPLKKLGDLRAASNGANNGRPSTASGSKTSSSSSSLSARRTVSQVGIASFLAAVCSTPAFRHEIERLRPSTNFLSSFVLSNIRSENWAVDTVVRLGLIFTFVGLVAALWFASSAVQVTLTTRDIEALLQALGSLLAAAAAKFVISVVALLLSLVVRLALFRMSRSVADRINELGVAFDDVAADEATAQEWFPEADESFAPVLKALKETSDALEAAMSSWLRERSEVVASIAATVRSAQTNVQLVASEDALRRIGDEYYQQLSAAFEKRLGRSYSQRTQSSNAGSKRLSMRNAKNRTKTR